ncbi:hypothetical protein PsYK624_052970 [Phanerochaete sordida]|uniref:Uncharacterized protein n=1 Tax=Phanerochaete sordida TaxID=48140 RepID=A0A9P3LCT8_9APHY|nr:hypothetical protein PsYK624_052970 [Phanerochaete sordida]
MFRSVLFRSIAPYDSLLPPYSSGWVRAQHIVTTDELYCSKAEHVFDERKHIDKALRTNERETLTWVTCDVQPCPWRYLKGTNDYEKSQPHLSSPNENQIQHFSKGIDEYSTYDNERQARQAEEDERDNMSNTATETAQTQQTQQAQQGQQTTDIRSLSHDEVLAYLLRETGYQGNTMPDIAAFQHPSKAKDLHLEHQGQEGLEDNNLAEEDLRKAEVEDHHRAEVEEDHRKAEEDHRKAEEDLRKEEVEEAHLKEEVEEARRNPQAGNPQRHLRT